MMRGKVILFCLFCCTTIVWASDIPMIWLLSDKIPAEVAVLLKRDLAKALITDQQKELRDSFVFEYREDLLDSKSVYEALKKITPHKASNVLLLNCGWGDIVHSENLPDTAAYRKYLKQILCEAQSKQLEVVWFSTPFQKDKSINKLVLQFNMIAAEVMEKADIRTIDFYGYWEQQSNRADFFRNNNDLKVCQLQSSYLAESLAQWWTALARSNRSVKRIKLWSDTPPLYRYEGNECVNAVARIDKISFPELEVFLPQNRKAATAVVFFPGGGYRYLGFLRNARELAELLNPYGIAVIGLKYRTGRTLDIPLTDAKRALRFVKAHAQAWGLNPARIGIAGQSAGAHLALSLTSALDEGDSDAIDKVERENCRPAFVAVFSSWNFLSMDSPFCFSTDTPPFFVRHAKDDNSFQLVCKIVKQLKEANVLSDVLFLDKGGHGAFEISDQNTGHCWPMDFVQWLAALKMIESTNIKTRL